MSLPCLFVEVLYIFQIRTLLAPCCKYLLLLYNQPIYTLNGVFWWREVINFLMSFLMVSNFCILFKKSFPNSRDYIILFYFLETWIFQLSHLNPQTLFSHFYLTLAHSSVTVLCQFRCTAGWHIYTCVYSSSNSFPIWVVTQYWAEFPVLYYRSLLVIYFKYSSVYMLIPNSQAIPPCNSSPLVTVNSFFKSVHLFLYKLFLLFYFCYLIFSFLIHWLWSLV